jgi:2',3'-cyclic-nucleotide 2'-phosphodiesterase (5'-nucleotidase family)
MSFILLLLGLLGFGKRPDLVILYTGNIAGYFEPRPAYWINPNYPPTLGGAASAATAIEQVREEVGEDRVLLLDTGPMTDIDLLHRGPGYYPTLVFMRELRYDVVVPGTRDFLLNINEFKKLSDFAQFDMVAANVSFG